MTGWKPQFAAALLALTIAGPAAAIEDQPDPPMLTAVKLELTTQILGGETKVVPNGSVLPYIVSSSCYGWRLSFTPIEDDVQLEERLTLPGPAVRWGEETNSTIAEDRRSATTPINADTYGGTAENSWCVSPGDPRGRYRFVVRHGKRVLGMVSFTLGAETKPAPAVP